jgi:hypothetical protein
VPKVLQVLREHLIGDDLADRLEKEMATFPALPESLAPTQIPERPCIAFTMPAGSDELVAIADQMSKLIFAISFGLDRQIQKWQACPPSRGYEHYSWLQDGIQH